MHVILTREGGSATILALEAVRKQLAPDTDLASVGCELGCEGTVNVLLTDGTAARLQLTDEKIQPELWPLQVTRDQTRDLLEPFNAHCKVLLELDVSVHCMAIDETHAERTIRDVFVGERSPPPDFRVIFDAEATRDFMTRLKGVFETGELAKAGVRDVLVTGFSQPQLMLEYRP